MIIKNAKIFGADFQFAHREVCTFGDIVSQTSDNKDVIDAKGLMLIPGLIDIHLHGAIGHDFMDANMDCLKSIASYQTLHGITSFCSATMTLSVAEIKKALVVAHQYRARQEQANLEGVYLEGPFISKSKLGSQNPLHVKQADPLVLDDLMSVQKDLIKVCTIAPEKPYAMKIIADYKKHIVFSIGHSEIDYETSLNAFRVGVTELTHSFNSMNEMLHRAPGPVGAAFEHGKVNCEIITDGVNVHPTMVKALFKLMGDEHIVMISDSMTATGLADGYFNQLGHSIVKHGKGACRQDGSIAGSVSNLYDCIKNAVLNIGIKLETALRACTYNPAKVIKVLDKVGTIEVGKRADLLLIDDELNIKKIILRGKVLDLG